MARIPPGLDQRGRCAACGGEYSTFFGGVVIAQFQPPLSPDSGFKLVGHGNNPDCVKKIEEMAMKREREIRIDAMFSRSHLY